MIIGITGGTGGLGRRLAEILLAQGYKIRLLVRNTGNLPFFSDSEIEYAYGNINDTDSLKVFVDNIDVCFHLAAQVGSACKNKMFLTNVEGTKNLCQAILETNPDCRFIYCSSIVVKNLNVYVFNRLFATDYAISKYYAEKVVLQYMNCIKTTIVYPGYIFGYYDRNFLPAIIKLLRYGLPFFVRGGEKNAPVIFVDDLCDLLIRSFLSDNAIGKKYVSLEKSDIGIHEFIRIVARELGYAYPSKIYPKWPLVVFIKAHECLSKVFKVTKQKHMHMPNYTPMPEHMHMPNYIPMPEHMPNYTPIPEHMPKISIRIINALSSRARFYNNAVTDLNWTQKTTYHDGIQKTLSYYKETGVI